MAAKKLELELPEEILTFLGQDPREVQKLVLQTLVLDLVHRGEITSSYGAKILGMNYHDFLDLMVDYEIPIINYDPQELDEEVELLKRVSPKQ